MGVKLLVVENRLNLEVGIDSSESPATEKSLPSELSLSWYSTVAARAKPRLPGRYVSK